MDKRKYRSAQSGSWIGLLSSFLHIVLLFGLLLSLYRLPQWVIEGGLILLFVWICLMVQQSWRSRTEIPGEKASFSYFSGERYERKVQHHGGR